MINIQDENLREYCKPVLDVKYVVGNGLDKKEVKNISQIKAIAELYHTTESLVKEGKLPYINICIDADGIRYAEITKEFITCVDNTKTSRPPEKNCRGTLSEKITRVNLGKAKNIADENFEDTIDERLDDEMYSTIFGYSGVIEIKSKRTPISREYSIIYFPNTKSLEDKMPITTSAGSIIDEQTHEPLIKIRNFRLFSN